MKESDQLRKLSRDIRDKEITDLAQDGLQYLIERIGDISEVVKILEASL